MLNPLKSDYPRDINGTMLLSAYPELNLPEIEISWYAKLSSKGTRNISSCTVRYPNHSCAVPHLQSKYFEDTKTTLEYNVSDPDNPIIYSVTLNSIRGFMDMDTGAPTGNTAVEAYISENGSEYDMVLITIAQYAWGALTDTLPIIDLSGSSIKSIFNYRDEIEEE